MTLALLAPATASAEDFDPSTEFKLKDWVPIHLGPLGRVSGDRRPTAPRAARER